MIRNQNYSQEISSTKLQQKTIAVYVRVSTDEQDGNNSKPNQLKVINTYISSNFTNFDVKTIIYDETMSASIPIQHNKNNEDYPEKYDFRQLLNRPELIRMLSDAELNKFTDICVYSHDRLSRDEFQTFIILSTLKALKVKIHYCCPTEQSTNNSEKSSKFLDYMFSCFANIEAFKISTRVTEGCEINARNGIWGGGKPPFGYKLQRIPNTKKKNKPQSKLKVCYQEAFIVNKIFYLYTMGYIPIEIIAEIKNLKLNSIYSRKWSTDAILSILRNPVYKGFQAYNKRGGKRKPNRNSEDKFIYADYNEDLAIVSQDIWEKSKQIRLQREASTTIHSTNFLLRDVLKCEHCNTVLESKNNGNATGNVYFCPNKSCKKIKPLKANILHNSFFKLLDIDITGLINSNKNKYNELFDNYVNLFTSKNKSLKTEIDIINNSLNEKNLLYNQGIEKLNYFNAQNLQIKTKNAFLITAINNRLVSLKSDIEILKGELDVKQKNADSVLIDKTSFANKLLSFNNLILDLDDSLQSRRLFRILLLDTFDSLYINENLEITIVLK